MELEHANSQTIEWAPKDFLYRYIVAFCMYACVNILASTQNIIATWYRAQRHASARCASCLNLATLERTLVVSRIDLEEMTNEHRYTRRLNSWANKRWDAILSHIAFFFKLANGFFLFFFVSAQVINGIILAIKCLFSRNNDLILISFVFYMSSYR